MRYLASDHPMFLNWHYSSRKRIFVFAADGELGNWRCRSSPRLAPLACPASTFRSTRYWTILAADLIELTLSRGKTFRKRG